MNMMEVDQPAPSLEGAMIYDMKAQEVSGLYGKLEPMGGDRHVLADMLGILIIGLLL